MSTADLKKQVLPADSSQRIDFATQPSAHKHWKLSLEGRVATLALDVDKQAALLAVNERLRDDYIADSQRGVARWNRAIQQYGIDFELTLPYRGFNRRIGTFAGHRVSIDGKVISDDQWEQQWRGWLPTEADHDFVQSLMKRVVQPGMMASWIAPPARGIDSKQSDFEYVKFG